MRYGVIDVALVLGHTPLMMLVKRTDYGISYVSGREPGDRVRLAAATAMRDEQRRFDAGHRSSDVLTASIGARRAWTVSVISALSIPCR